MLSKVAYVYLCTFPEEDVVSVGSSKLYQHLRSLGFSLLFSFLIAECCYTPISFS